MKSEHKALSDSNIDRHTGIATAEAEARLTDNGIFVLPPDPHPKRIPKTAIEPQPTGAVSKRCDGGIDCDGKF